MNKRISNIIYVASLCMLSSMANSQELPKSSDDTANEIEPASRQHDSANTGRMVFIDPETGEVASGERLTEVKASSKLKSSGSLVTSGVASEPELKKDGSILVKFNGQFMMPLSVTLDENGNFVKHHSGETLQEANGK